MSAMAVAADSGDKLKKEDMTDFRVRKVVYKMLTKRGYNIPASDSQLTPEEFSKRFVEARGGSADDDPRDLMTIQVQKIEDTAGQIFVFFPNEPKVGVEPIRRYVNRMQENETKRGIIVVKDNVTPFAKAAIEEMRPDFQIEVFRRIELLVDITEHELVPEHQVLTDGAKQQLLARYKLTEAQLPRLQKDDPVARYFGLERQQVVKIIRPSETAGRYVTYRIVW
jgi:DNA-directed RNA polymerases I, II, and III subunit RPABC1